jgi:hypothetical protein
MAILFVLTLLVVFIFFALAFDAGLWYFDHRTAQNQSEAAALAAVQELPALPGETGDASAAADDWLTKNGSGADERYCLDYSDRNSDGQFDTVRVCVRRKAPGIFAALSGIKSVWVSASATATVGPVEFATTGPWGIVPPDTDCDAIGKTCLVDLNGDGDTTDQGEQCSFLDCPFGLNPNRLYYFKCNSQQCDPADYTPGNFGSITACGNGSTNYRDCIVGVDNKGNPVIGTGFEVGEDVLVGAQTGVGGNNTDKALTNLVEQHGEVLSGGSYPCDVASTPDPENGLDIDVVTALTADDGLANKQACEHRKFVIPIIRAFPRSGSSEPIFVLGLAVFYAANWDRQGQPGDAEGNTTQACGTATGPPAWPCGLVWGYLLFGQNPDNRFLLGQIGDEPNPFAPLLAALIE